MTSLLRVVVGLALATTVASTAAGQQQMANYQLVIVKPGPKYESVSTPAGQEIIKEHVAHVYKLGADRLSMAAGPFIDDPSGIAGIHIMKTESVEKTREIMAGDAAIKAGIFAVEVLPFMSPDAGMRSWAEYPQLETVYFGFLNSGPNRGQDAETARRLQAEHIGYMEEQHKHGRLVFAGPFVDGGTHRGLVVYRAASLEEARKFAEGDPMVKIGRLAVDLHTWQVPTGSLPGGRN